MDDVANLPHVERRIYFEQTAARLGYLTPQLVEKDFWVCWVLRRVFELEEFGSHLTFKGGTSFSKVYNAIDRFSEDVDLSIERSYLGFEGESDPEQGISGKEIQRRVDRLRHACQEAISTQFVPQLQASIERILPHSNWALNPATDDPDSQTIEFEYPPAITEGLSKYFAPTIKLELGARSDHFPVHFATIQPYVAQALPEIAEPSAVSVRVLHGKRTFWEKATILHALCHQPIHRRFAARLSRHFYDLFRLADHEIGDQAINDVALLQRVATHKSIFFKAAWARYDLARPGTLRLVPDDERIAELTVDYRSMVPMFFRSPPSFDEILDRLRRLELTINTNWNV